jgi:hypothetical protein
MQDNQSGVEGVLTLNYNSHEEKDTIVSSAAQLSAKDKNTVELLEFDQEKKISSEDYLSKHSEKYTIDADKLVSLIKEHGSKVN